MDNHNMGSYIFSVDGRENELLAIEMIGNREQPRDCFWHGSPYVIFELEDYDFVSEK